MRIAPFTVLMHRHDCSEAVSVFKMKPDELRLIYRRGGSATGNPIERPAAAQKKSKKNSPAASADHQRCHPHEEPARLRDFRLMRLGHRRQICRVMHLRDQFVALVWDRISAHQRNDRSAPSYFERCLIGIL